MSEQIKMIAQRFKALREICDFSIAEISNKLSITPELYTQYESGNVEIPVSLLYEICLLYTSKDILFPFLTVLCMDIPHFLYI